MDPVVITGAAVSLSPERQNGDERRGAVPVMPVQQWQSRSLGYYNMLGECWNPAQFIPTAMSKMRFFPAVMGDDGKPEEITRDMDPDVVDAVDVLQRVAFKYGLLMWLVGETRLCQYRDHDDEDDAPVRWDCFSPVEIKLTDQNRLIVRSPYGQGQRITYRNISSDEEGADPEPGEMRTWRFWRPHPEASELADSPVRPVLDLYEQLWWLTMGERADLQNRIADNGFLLAPIELDWKPPGAIDQEGADEDTEDGTLVEYVGEVMMTAISDPGSATAAVPGVIEGKAEYLKEMRMLHTHEGSQSLVFVSQREESIIKRLSQNLPLPPEAMTGMSQANHWTAWKIEDEKWQLTEPWVSGFCDDTTAVYLRPMLLASGKDPDIFVHYDYSDLVSDPDRGATAIKLHQEGLLAGLPVLNANGWSEEDMMEGEELDWFRAIAMKDSAIAGVESEDQSATDSSGPPDEQPPDEERESETPDQAEMKRRIIVFADQRARAKIGAYVRGRKRSCPDCLAGLEDVPNQDLLAALDGETLEKLGLRPTVAIEQITAEFVAIAEGLGYDASNLLPALAQWFALTLHTPEPLPADLVGRIGLRGNDTAVAR
jgi:hypothetical protein